MSSNLIKIKRALVSLSDKTNIDILVKIFQTYDIEIISTGGTAKILRKYGLKVIEVSNYTDFPEMLNGRIKTLHPKIHGGLLGRHTNPTHKKEMQANNIYPIQLLIVNLYPFSKAISKNLNYQFI